MAAKTPAWVEALAWERDESLQRLCSCVTTYEQAHAVIPAMRDFVQSSMDLAADLGFPLTTAMPYGWGERPGKTRRFSDADQLMTIAQEILRGDKWPALLAYDRSWRNRAYLTVCLYNHLYVFPFDEAEIRLGLQPSFCVELECLGDRMDKAAEWMAAAVDALAESTGAVYGLAGRENNPTLNSLYEDHGQKERAPGDHLDENDRVARGSFWCNFLTDKHIETLGGVDRIRREAPCAIVEESERTGPVTTQVRLQVTERFSETTWEMLDELEEYLDPLLP